MNNHTELQNRLAAYCDGDLDPAEQRLVEQHLGDCHECRLRLADLHTALRLIRSTPEIEPPPWLTGKIMAHIREQQAEKRSWLQRLFLPLHIKLPMEVIALLVVCVSGYYMTRTVETDMKQATQQQLRDIPAQPAPQPSSLSLQSPAADKQTEADITAPKPRTVAPPAVETAAPTRREDAPPMVAPRPTSAPVPTGFAPSPPAATQDYPGKGGMRKAAPAAEPASEMKMERSSNELRQKSAPPAAAGRAAVKDALSLHQLAVRLDADNPAAAAGQIREALIRSGGTVADGPGINGRRLTGRIPPERLTELLERLGRLGRITQRPSSPSGTQSLEVTVQW